MDISPADFQQKQQTIYANDFHDAMSMPEVMLESSVSGTDSGCLLVLRYPDDLCANLVRVAEALCGDIKRLHYDASNLHTTLLTGPKLPKKSEASDEHLAFFDQAKAKLAELLEQNTEQGDVDDSPSDQSETTDKDPYSEIPHEDALKSTLAEEHGDEIDKELGNSSHAASDAENPSDETSLNALAEVRKLNLELQGLLVNRNSMIAASRAKDTFWLLAHQMLEVLGAENGWKMPWGSHLTIARFMESGVHLPRTQDAISLGLLAAISELHPDRIELVWFECDENGFRFV